MKDAVPANFVFPASFAFWLGSFDPRCWFQLATLIWEMLRGCTVMNRRQSAHRQTAFEENERASGYDDRPWAPETELDNFKDVNPP